MSGSKLQVTVLTGLLAGGVAFVQGALPRLANSSSLLYLRAEYKLATGDTSSAMQLMQRAASQRQRQETPQTVQQRQPESVQSCPRQAATQPVKVSTKGAANVPLTVAVQVPGPHPNRIMVTVPDKWTIMKAQLMAQAHIRQAEQSERLAKSMEMLQAKLRNMPVPPVSPVVPPAFPAE